LTIISLGFNSYPRYLARVSGQLSEMLPDQMLGGHHRQMEKMVLHLLVSIVCLTVDVCMVDLGDVILVPCNSDMPITWTLS